MVRTVFLAACLVALSAFGSVLAADRVALVIGNSAYQSVPALNNPANDADDVATALEALDFEVTKRNDLGQAEMLDALRSFQREAARAQISFVYYAGHGLEIDRNNHLIPVDARLETDLDTVFETISLETVLLAAGGARQLSLVVVDACRDNPFVTTMTRTSATRSVGRGLSIFEPTKNTLLAYSAKAGTTASDGDGRNSPYAKALVTALAEPGLEVGLMLRQVRDAVLRETGGLQEPFVYGSLSADPIILNPVATKEEEPAVVAALPAPSETLAPAPAPAPPAATAPQRSAPAQAEIVFWESIANSRFPADFEDYLAAYPNGIFTPLAQRRLDRLRAEAEANAPAPAPVPAPAVVADPTPQPVEEPRVARAEPTAVPVPPAPAAPEPLTREEVQELQERLTAGGYEPGGVDGIPGRRTAAAIRRFEEQRGMAVLGEASRPVLDRIRQDIGDAKLAAWRTQIAADRRAAEARRAEERRAAAERRRARERAAAASRTQQSWQPPAPAAKPAQQSTANPRANSQFCRTNRIVCESTDCRRRPDDGWACGLCTHYQQLCK